MKAAALLLLAACLSLQAAAQIPESPNTLDGDGLKTGQWTVTFDSAWKPATDPALIRYYRIMTYQAGKPVGTVHDYYLSGKLQTEGVMLTDDPETWDGVITGYFENGKKQFEETWKDGHRDGTMHYWHENGKQQAEIPWRDGKQNGMVRYWYENGEKQAEAPFVNGQRHGTVQFWDETGKLSVTEWENGKRVK